MSKILKTKVKYILPKLLHIFSSVLSVFLMIFSTVILFVPWDDTNLIVKRWIFIGLVISIVAMFVIILIFLIYRVKIKLKVNANNVRIYVGNIFKADSDALKIIHCNEYFDTKLGYVVSEKTLHGQYIKKFYSQQKDREDLDRRIKGDLKNYEIDSTRLSVDNKDRKYPLGELFLDSNGYVLLAFSRFDKDNRAFLYPSDYWQCLLNMWENLDKINNGRKIVINLLGAGITRFNRISPIEPQVALETMLLSLKFTNKKFPGGIDILLNVDMAENIKL